MLSSCIRARWKTPVVIDPHLENHRLPSGMSTAPPEISLIVPAYNEGDRIASSLESIAEFCRASDRTIEVLLVNDGSSDRTTEIANALAAKLFPPDRFHLLEYGGNRGKGFAVKHGIERARGRWILFTDTDLSAPIDQIPKLASALEQGADLAIASRKLPQSEVIGLPLARRVMSLGFSLLSRLLVLPGIRDTQCGFKAYRSEAAKELAASQTIFGYTFDVEHLLLARQRRFKIVEIPVRWIYTEGSRVNGLRDSLRMIRDLLELRRRRIRMR